LIFPLLLFLILPPSIDLTMALAGKELVNSVIEMAELFGFDIKKLAEDALAALHRGSTVDELTVMLKKIVGEAEDLEHYALDCKDKRSKEVAARNPRSGGSHHAPGPTNPPSVARMPSPASYEPCEEELEATNDLMLSPEENKPLWQVLEENGADYDSDQSRGW
jgi:hypothetical protein